MADKVYLDFDNIFTIIGRQSASLLYRDIKIFLKQNNIPYQFIWKDTGQWLPSGVFVDAEEDITFLKLKLGL